MSNPILGEAINSILACPTCKETLSLEKANTSLKCVHCKKSYPILNGIPILLPNEKNLQEEEKEKRDKTALDYVNKDSYLLLKKISLHHCIPMMQHYANCFYNRFTKSDWMCDIGIGWGWHWAGLENGCKIVGIDMSLGNLMVAKKLIGENRNLLLICADAAAMPFKDKTLSGIWSVQVFQHFPEEVLSAAKSEMDRILKENYLIEIFNLNATIFNRIIYFILRKNYHIYGKSDYMILNRFSKKEWTNIFADFRKNNSNIAFNYSELFFHPDLRFIPNNYPVRFELFLAKFSTKLARFLARQTQLRIEGR